MRNFSAENFTGMIRLHLIILIDFWNSSKGEPGGFELIKRNDTQIVKGERGQKGETGDKGPVIMIYF
jgi:hypothetical protein